VFLNHPEGFPLKHLIDYREELLSWYRRLSNRKNAEKYIDKLVDSTDNSANKKVSRIRETINKAIDGYNISVADIVPMGTKGEFFLIAFNRKRLIWR
jgi:hypothetical protein